MSPPPKYVDDDDDTDEISDEDDEVPRRRRNSAFKRAVRKITLARVRGLIRSYTSKCRQKIGSQISLHAYSTKV